MDFRRPLRVVTPTLEGDVLLALARVDGELTGGDVHRLAERGSRDGVRDALDRLVEQGVVQRRAAGRAHLYSFNRDHLAARWIEGLAGIRGELVGRLREQIASWSIQPVAAALFGSVARGEAGPGSDVDLLLVRPSGADEHGWDAQVAMLAVAAARWTGNDVRPLELAEDEVGDAANARLLRDVLDHGVELGGSLDVLRRAWR